MSTFSRPILSILFEHVFSPQHAKPSHEDEHVYIHAIDEFALHEKLRQKFIKKSLTSFTTDQKVTATNLKSKDNFKFIENIVARAP